MKSILDKKKTDLDLTSLLDVIFIILMAVMCAVNVRAEGEAADAAETTEEEQTAQSAVDKKDGADDNTEDLVEIGRDIATVRIETSLGTEEDADDCSHREFVIYVNEDETPYNNETIVIDPDNEEASYTEISEDLSKIVESSKNSNGAYIPVLLSVDNGQLLYRDAQKLNEIVDAIRENGQGSNLYYEEFRE